MISLSLVIFIVLVAYILGVVTVPLLVYMRLVKTTKLQPVAQVNRR